MKLELVRYGFGVDSTLGKLSIDGTFACFTLEDERRVKKVKGETAIPHGNYVVTFRVEGGFHARYQKAHPDIHEGMLWIRDVPGFEYILIHQGNTDDDTAGCVLVGARAMVTLDGEFNLQDSRIAYRHVYPKVAAALLRGEPVTIGIRELA